MRTVVYGGCMNTVREWANSEGSVGIPNTCEKFSWFRDGVVNHLSGSLTNGCFSSLTWGYCSCWRLCQHVSIQGKPLLCACGFCDCPEVTLRGQQNVKSEYWLDFWWLYLICRRLHCQSSVSASKRERPGCYFTHQTRGNITNNAITYSICHKYHFCNNKTLSWQTCVCCDKCVFVATEHFFFLRQKYACRGKKNCSKIVFVATNICCNKHNLSWQAYFCHDKHMFVITKRSFVMTEVCLWQKFCRYKIMFVATK